MKLHLIFLNSRHEAADNPPKGDTMKTMSTVYCLFFEGYETLDAMGPIEFLHRAPNVQMRYLSVPSATEPHELLIRSSQGFALETERIEKLDEDNILLIPGGAGTRTLVQDKVFLRNLEPLIRQSGTCLTVCTGAALAAATGMLDGLEATTNKRAFDWVCSTRPQVRWRARARWVQAEKFYTSSGISAGMDMTLGFIADRWGSQTAQEIAERCEYTWHSNPDLDPFARPDL